MGVLHLARSGFVTFAPWTPPDGIVNICVRLGYPKQQDFFWYALLVVAGPVGALVATALWKRMAAKPSRRRGFLPWAAAGAVASTLLAIANDPGWAVVGLILAAASIVAPWADGGWYRGADPVGEGPRHPGGRVGAGFAAGAVILAGAWVFDSCILRRPIDGFHEGSKLLFVQSWLSGDSPGAAFPIDYGPLYLASVRWWMEAFGVTLSSLRWHFLAAQAAGLVVQLVVLRALGASRLAVAAGAWLLLTCSSVSGIQYGMPNAMRLALPMAAVAIWGGAAGRRGAAAAGALLAAAWLFSPEYGVAAGAACAVAGLAAGTGERRRPPAEWVTAAFAAAGTAALLLVLAYGNLAGEAALRLLGPGHGIARLLGQGACPAPRAIWWTGWRDLAADAGGWYALATYWGPGLLASGVAAWLAQPLIARRGAVAGWLVLALVSLVPVVIRPAGQQVNAVPAAAALAVLALDAALIAGPVIRLAGRAAAVLAFAAGAAALVPHAGAFGGKPVRCIGDLKASNRPGNPSELAGLGGVMLPSETARQLAGAVAAVWTYCPAGSRVYVGAISWAHVPFLAGRPGLPPFPLAVLAATEGDRNAELAALERDRPPVALVSEAGFDMPFAEEHAAEAAYLAAHYRTVGVFGDLRVMVRRGAAGAVRRPGSAGAPFD